MENVGEKMEMDGIQGVISMCQWSGEIERIRDAVVDVKRDSFWARKRKEVRCDTVLVEKNFRAGE